MPRLRRASQQQSARDTGRVGTNGATGANGQNGEEMPRVLLTRGRVLGTLVFVASALAFLYFVLPKLLGLNETWNRIQHGNGWWLGLAAVLEVCSFLGYVWLFRGVFIRGDSRIDWSESYQITMASLAATRLFAAAGAGGIALTAWALRRSGMGTRTVACRMIAFMALLYGVYMVTLVVVGVGLYLGVIPGQAPFAITIVPAVFGFIVIVLFLGISMLPGDATRRVSSRVVRPERIARMAVRLADASATAARGVRTAIDLVRARHPSLLGAIAWWGFDIAVLWACFHAFGGSPPKGVIVMSYFVGMLGNTLPLPGGIGGVDGGMIGAFTAFGVDVELSVVAVLAYRAFAFWLPTLPGAVAYLQLRRTVQRWSSEPSRMLRGVSEPAS
ncbi:MAG TPA: lysylphosphatidylglycerol synthase transmembrane domain-containing protein [Solirubrobacteraceae bacterium]|nr:lysylphosphatidylglycerol synthase transmembrane domain-containing protein [Solirubrobacteraceae bacterium]